MTKTLSRRGRVKPVFLPIEPFRDALLRSTRSVAMIAEEMGLLRGSGEPDEPRVRRELGTLWYRKTSDGTKVFRTEIEQGRAIAYIRAMDFDPVDFGL